MTMKEWVAKLDDFLKLSERRILIGAGSVSNEIAEEKAHREYEKYCNAEDAAYMSDFDRETKKYLASARSKPRPTRRFGSTRRSIS